ncbi:hypothetical protein H0H92_001047 [Tricholoma furcatifolium]|nr:hypothetical protein H0H92_001047 [Tricholoma furcatifolium]
MLLLQSIIQLVPFYLIYASFASAQKTNEILDAKTEAFVNQILKDWKSPGGLAIAFVKKDAKGVWLNIETQGYGRATASGKNVTRNTLFNVASNSKLFTVAATGLLIHNTSINPQFTWDTPITAVVPEFNTTDPVASREARFIDLLSHRTGYPRHEFSYRYNDTVSDVITKMHSWRQSYEFRDIWQYNNNMYTLMGSLQPRLLNGTSFAQYVKNNIFVPLGLNSTTYSYQVANATGNLADGMARQNWNLYSGDVFAGTPAAAKWWAGTNAGDNGNVLSASGGVISNAVDIATWMQTLLLEGRNPKTNMTVIPADVINRAALAVIPQSYRPEFPEVSLIAYGSAQTQITYRNHPTESTTSGFNSQVSRLPNDGIGVAVLTNDNEYGKLISQLVKYYIMDRALGLTPIDWSTRHVLLPPIYHTSPRLTTPLYYRLMAQKTTPPPKATPRPANATLPSANFTLIAGTYNNAGYGTFELCLVQPSSSNATPSCGDLVRSLPTILPGAVRANIPTFFGAIDSPWFSHVRIEHFNQNLFNVSFLISTVRSNASLSTSGEAVAQNNATKPYWTYNDQSASDNGAVAEVEVVNGRVGLGMAGIWYGLWEPNVPPATPKPQGNTVRERAEVYWDKL